MGRIVKEQMNVASGLLHAVRFGGLRAAPQLNGQRGILELWDPSSRRWKVRLISTGEIKSVKPENLSMEEENVASRGPSTNGTARVPGSDDAGIDQPRHGRSSRADDVRSNLLESRASRVFGEDVPWESLA
eukprot:s3136_g5.t1